MKKHLCITFFLLSIIIIYYVYCNFDELNESFTSEPLEIKDGYDTNIYQDNSNYSNPIVYSKDQLDQVASIQKIDKKSNKDIIKEDSKKLQHSNNKMLSNEENLAPKGNVDYENYDLEFTTQNVHKDKSNMTAFDKDLMKLSHKVNDKFEYGNEDCKNTADIKLDTDTDPVMCSKEEIKHSPYDVSMSNYSEVNFNEKTTEVKSVPKKKVMSSKPKDTSEDAVVKVTALDMNSNDFLINEIPKPLNTKYNNLLNIERDSDTEEKVIQKVKKEKSDKNNKINDHSTDNVIPLKKISHKDHIEYDDEKCEVLRDGVERLNDKGFLHNKQNSWNNTFKEDCGHY